MNFYTHINDLRNINNNENENGALSQSEFTKLYKQLYRSIPMIPLLTPKVMSWTEVDTINITTDPIVPHKYLSLLISTHTDPYIIAKYSYLAPLVTFNAYTYEMMKVLFPMSSNHLQLIEELTIGKFVSSISSTKPKKFSDDLTALQRPPGWLMLERLMLLRPAIEFLFIDQRNYQQIIKYTPNLECTLQAIYLYNEGNVLLTAIKRIQRSNNTHSL